MPPEKENLSRVVETLKALGQLHLANSQYREATEKYEQIIRLGVKDPEVYHHLALALAGQKLYTPETLRLYIWALEKFPHDKKLCLHVAEAGLHNNAEDEQALRFYEAALKLRPAFTKELYLRLHQIFDRQGKFDDSFQALKQALYLEKSDDDQLVTRLTHLGWRYERQEELIMTLRFLFGNHAENPTLRHALACTLAHAIILHHKQKPGHVDFPLGSENDLQLIRTSLPNIDARSTLETVRDYCILQLALFFSRDKNFSANTSSPQPNKGPGVGLPAFEYRSLLNDLPLEEVLANASSTQPSLVPELSRLAMPASDFDWQRDLLEHLPGNKKPEKQLKPVPVSTPIPAAEKDASRDPNETLRAQSEIPVHSLLVLATVVSERNKNNVEETSHPEALDTPVKSIIDFVVQHFESTNLRVDLYVLRDGVLVFGPEPRTLAIEAVQLFKKVERFNLLIPEQRRIVLQAALHTIDRSRSSGFQANQNEYNRLGLELLYNTLHLLQAESEEANARLPAPEGKSMPVLGRETFNSRLIMDRHTFESALGVDAFTAKSWGKAYWGAPGLWDEVYEMIWYNPLDYINERKPLPLGRFLVIEKFQERKTYGTYRARDRSLERPVVLKALYPEVYHRWRQDKTRFAKIIGHLRCLGRLEHPGVSLIHDMGVHGEIFFFVREYIEGENLAQTLHKKQRLSPAEALHLMIAVCRILDHAHQNGVSHGNLKPSNVWQLKPVTMDEMLPAQLPGRMPLHFPGGNLTWGIKISDFLVPGFGEITETTWHYVAPERLFHETTQPAENFPESLSVTIDIFALGMILYECLSGRHPFTQVNLPASCAEWEAVTITPPSAIAHDSAGIIVPSSCDEIVLRALHRDPQQRFQNIEELEAALLAAVAQMTEATSPARDQPSNQGADD
ncbi:MAG: protein kinase [candidate division KSB1 bacterium]|nr:protein kinase [candidate division KSB1 bacterium]MDZ7302704.1 protein kinase [candidate division KSB1 bacterium]MDZ7311765.1 protein kinase [candidate division KSB1 bacterium]